MFAAMNPEQITLLLILLGALVLLLTERIRIDLTAVLIIIALAVAGLLSREDVLSGFSSEPALIVAAVFVLSGAWYYTGLSDRLGNIIGRLAGAGYARMVAVIMLSVAGLSAFTHHLTITAVMLPVTLKLSRQHDIPASKLLMPMSFAASLGTTITILGAPAFLLAHRILQQAGHDGLGVFAIAPIGLVLSATGVLFTLTLGRFLLPDRQGGDIDHNRFRLNGYYTEILISAESALVGKRIDEIETAYDKRFQIAGWLRRGRPRARPYGQKYLKAEDVLLVRTTPEELATIQKEPGVALRPLLKYGEEAGQFAANGNGNDETEPLVQAVIAPGSDLVGRTIGKINFLEQYGVIVVGIWRRRSWLRAKLSRVRLRAGDVLVLLGEEAALARIEKDRSFLMLVPFEGEPFMRHKAPIAGFVMVLSIAAAAFNVLPVEIALLVGAVAVVLTGCLTIRQAYQSIDVRIFVFIAGAIPLGLAMEKTGTAALLAGWLQGVIQNWPVPFILLLLFVTAALMTQLMSDAGTVALLGPVAVALAQALGQSPEPYVVTVAMAAVASFLTPIGHHGNLLIYGPGSYRFLDFLKVGTPLTLLVALITAFLTPMIWPV